VIDTPLYLCVYEYTAPKKKERKKKFAMERQFHTNQHSSSAAAACRKLKNSFIIQGWETYALVADLLSKSTGLNTVPKQLEDSQRLAKYMLVFDRIAR
jgi:hypothetical protein